MLVFFFILFSLENYSIKQFTVICLYVTAFSEVKIYDYPIIISRFRTYIIPYKSFPNNWSMFLQIKYSFNGANIYQNLFNNNEIKLVYDLIHDVMYEM